MTEPSRRWGVVGGGVLGMHLAQQLAAAGHDVTLVESSPELGGLAAPWAIGPVTWDRHYHVIAPGDQRTIALVRELGLEDDLRWQSVPAGCESEGTVSPATTPGEIVRLPFLGPAAKLRLATTAARAATVRDTTSLEDVLVTDWLRRWSGKQATERFWKPLLKSKLGSNVDVTSAAFIVTTLQRLLQARRDGGNTGDGFGYVVGGYERILGAMASRMHEAGVEALLGHRVEEVRRSDSGVSVRRADGSTSTFDRVVVTAASPVASMLCPDLAESERSACSSVTYQGIACLSVLLNKPLTKNYITYLMSALPFTAVVDMSALVGAKQLQDHGLVYLPRYVRSDDPLLSRDEDSIVEEFLGSLPRVYPEFRRADVVAVRLSRAKYVLPVPTLGYSSKLPPMRTSVPGLFLASSALITDGTLNVNETLGVAERVLPELLAS